jgi:polyhydroxyalkanoate synthesis regulator phasin
MAEKLTKREARRLIDLLLQDMEEAAKHLEEMQENWESCINKYGAEQMEACLTKSQQDRMQKMVVRVGKLV